MILTVPSCSSLVFTTNSITGISDVDLISLQLTYKFSCGSSVVLDLTADQDTIVNSTSTETTFTITPAQFYDSATAVKFCEGVYYFEWLLIYSDSPDTITFTDSVCSLVDCEGYIKCKVKDYVLSSLDVRPIYMLDAIGYASECDNCNCTSMCSMYNDLLATINLSTNGTTDGCGCS